MCGFNVDPDRPRVALSARQGLVIIAWGLSGDREPTFGVDGLPLVGVMFFPSSSLVGVVLFPSDAQ